MSSERAFGSVHRLDQSFGQLVVHHGGVVGQYGEQKVVLRNWWNGSIGARQLLAGRLLLALRDGKMCNRYKDAGEAVKVRTRVGSQA